jgi:hypothetical protein
MAVFYLYLLVLTCIGLLTWGVIRVERIYQYPFLMGSMFLSFLIPQAFALVKNPGPVTQTNLEGVLLYTSLCAACCLFGYIHKPQIGLLKKLHIIIDERKLFNAGLFLMLQGHFFNYLISRTPITVASNGNWTGPGTIYVFFAQVINIAFAIFMLQALKKPKPINIACAIISGMPIFQSVLLGRRQPTMTFLIIIGLSLWMLYKMIPPRWIIVVSLISMAFLIPLFGALRDTFWTLLFSGQVEKVLELGQKAFDELLKGDSLEYRNSALLMDVVEKTSLYGFGAGFWDSIIFQYVPGQLVGFELKKALQFNLMDTYINYLANFYGYTMPIGSTITGIGDTFIEFGYLGCLTFAVIGYLLKHIWISALYQNSLFSQILYMGLASPIMVCLTHGVGRFLQESIFQLIFLSLVVYYAKARYSWQSLKL